MNLSPYVFVWKSGGEVFSYPNDYTVDIFRYVHNVDFAYYDSALIIKREEQAVYYIYIRQLSRGEGLGLCCVTTYSYIPDLKALIKAFDNTVKRMSQFGCLICESNYERIIFMSEWYSPKAKGLNQDDAEKALNCIEIKVSKLDVKSDLLPVSLEVDSVMVYYLNKSDLKGFDRSRFYSSDMWIIPID